MAEEVRGNADERGRERKRKEERESSRCREEVVDAVSVAA